MAKEILAIPEEHLQEVIYIIRAGIEYVQATSEIYISHETIENLIKWCDYYEEKE